MLVKLLLLHPNPAGCKQQWLSHGKLWTAAFTILLLATH